MKQLSIDLMWLPWVGGAVAFMCTLILTPIVIRLAYRKKWIALPKKDRWHERPTALMGGIAIYAGATIALPLFFFFGVPWQLWLGATIMFVTGLVDDLKTIRPGGKLAAQVVATGLLLLSGYSFGEGLPFWIVVPLTFFWTIGITNAINLLDNMDGLAAGISSIAALVLAVFSFLAGNVAGLAIAMLIVGASAGFLFFNFKPARIFMGDSGSMFLGYTIAALALLIQSDAQVPGEYTAYLISAMVMAIPIFDTTLVTLVRTLAGRSISQGGRDHVSHRLVFLGLSEKRAVLTLYGISLFFGATALVFQFTQPALFYALFLLMAVALTVFGIYLASVDVYRKSEDLGFYSTRAYILNEKFFSMLHALFGRSWKASFGVIADLLLIVSVFILAHYLRFESEFSATHTALLERVLPAVVAVKIAVFYLAGLYRGIWRHAGTPELMRVALATAIAGGASFGVVGMISGFEQLSISVFVIDWVLISCATAGVRFGFRGLRQYIAGQRQSGRRVLLYGAGDAGAMALREFRHNQELANVPIGFIDDDPLKHGMTIHGIPVMGDFDDLGRIISEYQPEAVVITANRMTEARKTEICVECTRLDIECFAFQLSFEALPTWPEFGTLIDAETKEAH